MKNNYSQIQDFLNDDSFVKYVLFGEDNNKWEQYRRVNSEKSTIFDQSKKLIEEIRSIEMSENEEVDAKKIWQKMKLTIGERYENKVVKVILWEKLILKIAASISILFGIGYFIYYNQTKEQLTFQMLVANLENKEIIQIEKNNDGTSPLKINLEDGSIVTLEKNSKLSYPTHFQKDKRMVILEGEALFEIAKNPEKPFYVYANEIVTKVLGTSFSVKATENGKDIIVKVISGKVSVYNQRKINFKDPESNALILLPNQKAIFSRDDKLINKQLVDVPLPVKDNLQQSLPIEFDEASVNQVLEVIQKLYKVKIIYNEEELANCLITTRLQNESLYDQLDLICKIIGGTYKEIDAQIVLESKGCK
jgi:transmembrane sensor